MLPRPKKKGSVATAPRNPVTWSSVNHDLGLESGGIMPMVHLIAINFIMPRSANRRVPSRPKKSGNTAAGVPRPTGEGVNHLPGAGAVANRDQVSPPSASCCPCFIHAPAPEPLFPRTLVTLDLPSVENAWMGWAQGLAWAERRAGSTANALPEARAAAPGQLISLHALLPTGLLPRLSGLHAPGFFLFRILSRSAG